MITEVEIHSCAELIDYVREVGFLPLLDSGIRGFSAEDLVDDDCRYVIMSVRAYIRHNLWQKQ